MGHMGTAGQGSSGVNKLPFMFPGSCCDLSDLWGGKCGRQDVLGWHLNAPQCVQVKSVHSYSLLLGNTWAISSFSTNAAVWLSEYQHNQIICCSLLLPFDSWGKICFTHALFLSICLLIMYMTAHILHLDTTTGIYYWSMRSSSGTLVGSVALGSTNVRQFLLSSVSPEVEKLLLILTCFDKTEIHITNKTMLC